KMNVAKGGYRVFSANSNAACTELAKRITERLGVELGKAVVYQEPNRETRVEIKESAMSLMEEMMHEINDLKNFKNTVEDHMTDIDKDMDMVRYGLQVPFPGIELPMMMPKEKPPITVVGDVGGRIAIIVDDIIDDVDGFVAAAEILKERGAYKIYVMATHGLLSADAPCLIEESAINEVVVTNTIPHEVQKLQCPKIKTVDVSMILSEAIRRIHNGESMSYLFRNITVDD
ncbi:hypothetical protein chiPu_0020741, partial [Chiloscyllium punctatum]|nr:hypothetical protein [Chiloscyllium punctatum]